ncbi:NAD(P)H-quinone oxidoreductase [Marinomonas piezotolerans]|uniref:NAD(P)H-quinone oxidoreductase n=1 Tax=Marinomonas piezotolerans TaxID=2213058 RepID=A0A370U5D1_9GAMM|nr:NAD(P)H:quinone oxidoreductase [Marinomonas piezotolerans]RDL42981.1 NAD(P)H-quinone oxidoreductase [Marinomonas piezotolerans]
MPIKILIVFYSRHGSVAAMAKHIARGAQRIANTDVIVRQLPDASFNSEQTRDAIPEEGYPFCEIEELAECDGLAIGSPSYFGSMAAPVKLFLDQSSPLWMSGQLIDKPACAFASASTMHGGHEMTLHSMMIPLMHHGMVWVGLPYKNRALISTTAGGTPYGVTHLASQTSETDLTDDEKSLCEAQGQRLAELATTLKKT